MLVLNHSKVASEIFGDIIGINCRLTVCVLVDQVAHVILNIDQRKLFAMAWHIQPRTSPSILQHVSARVRFSKRAFNFRAFYLSSRRLNKEEAGHWPPKLPSCLRSLARYDFSSDLRIPISSLKICNSP